MRRLIERCVLLANLLLGMAVVVWPVVGRAAEPARQWVVYLLPHSHVDIGYTALQPDVEQKQMQNIDAALELCRKTADYPPEARFKWNTEVLWAVDSYLHKAPPEKQRQLIDAVRAGQIELDALYGNELTGLCRPEELLRLCDYAQQLSKRCGVKIDSAMISDVPGYTWGIVPALSQAGVKYFSLGINFMRWRTRHRRLGRQALLLARSRRPPKDPLLGALQGLRARASIRRIQAGARLAQTSGPTGTRWAIPTTSCNCGGTSAATTARPTRRLPDVVKDWNAKHAYPQDGHRHRRRVVPGVREAIRRQDSRRSAAISRRTGRTGPVRRPAKRRINRTAAERLVQAEILPAMLDPRQYPATEFDAKPGAT